MSLVIRSYYKGCANFYGTELKTLGEKYRGIFGADSKMEANAIFSNSENEAELLGAYIRGYNLGLQFRVGEASYDAKHTAYSKMTVDILKQRAKPTKAPAVKTPVKIHSYRTGPDGRAWWVYGVVQDPYGNTAYWEVAHGDLEDVVSDDVLSSWPVG